MTTEYCFLLGAGASVPAGVPAMSELYKLYLDKLTVQEVKFINQLENEVDFLQAEDKELNLESLFEVLDLITNLDNRLIKSFFGNFKEGILNHLNLVPAMLKKLKMLIRRECNIQKKDIEYLLPLMKFIHESDSLQVFTLNYDLTIETLCELYRINYTDGFDLVWKPELLQREDYDVRLYKLHGSIIWYQTERGKRLKLPIINYDKELRYFLGTELSGMLVYPEHNKYEPFKNLLNHFDQELLRKKVLISIGYSFGDPLIRQMVLDGLKDNPKLHIYLVSPSAQKIAGKYFSQYQDRLVIFNKGINEFLADKSLYIKLRALLKSKE